MRSPVDVHAFWACDDFRLGIRQWAPTTRENRPTLIENIGIRRFLENSCWMDVLGCCDLWGLLGLGLLDL